LFIPEFTIFHVGLAFFGGLVGGAAACYMLLDVKELLDKDYSKPWHD